MKRRLRGPLTNPRVSLRQNTEHSRSVFGVAIDVDDCDRLEGHVANIGSTR